MVIYAGRNDEMIKANLNIILNDLHMYDYWNNQWITVVLYGGLFEARTFHCIAAFEENKLMVFGGNGLRTFIPST